ncbi:MAG: aspartate kinase, partial [Bacteroidales bacterium]|nr:aspartate kinase [Bacteroidales bacterium]
MKVYKFGGASVKTPQAIENVYNIIKDENELVIVVSAIDKTTNHLERLVNYYFNGDEQKNVEFENIKKFHLDYVAKVFGGKTETVCKKLNALFEEIAERIDGIPTD